MFYLLILCRARRRAYDRYLCSSPHDCLCSQWDQWDKLRQKPVLLKSQVWMLDMWANISSSRKKPKAEGFLPILWHYARGKNSNERASCIFPTSFNVASFMLTPDAASFQLDSEFLMNLSMYSCWIGVSTWGAKVQGFLFKCLLDVTLTTISLCNWNEHYNI